VGRESGPLPREEAATWKVLRNLTEETRPGSGLDCIIYAILARQGACTESNVVLHRAPPAACDVRAGTGIELLPYSEESVGIIDSLDCTPACNVSFNCSSWTFNPKPGSYMNRISRAWAFFYDRGTPLLIYREPPACPYWAPPCSFESGLARGLSSSCRAGFAVQTRQLWGGNTPGLNTTVMPNRPVASQQP